MSLQLTRTTVDADEQDEITLKPGPGGKRRRMVAISMQLQVMHPVPISRNPETCKNSSLGNSRNPVYLQLTWATVAR